MSLCIKATVVVLFLSVDKALCNRNLLYLEIYTLNSIIKGYDSIKRPSGVNGTGPVEVEVNTYIRRIGGFDDIKMVYDAELTLRQTWKDERLKYNNTDLNYLTLKQKKSIWVPDSFFPNEVSGHFHDITEPNMFIRIYPDGQVLYSTRISLKLSCPMKLHSYPLDNQVCSIILTSYGYTTENLVFHWKYNHSFQTQEKSWELRKFKFYDYDLVSFITLGFTGNYSGLKLGLHLSRNFHTFFINIYLPTTSLVLLSGIVFWLNPKYCGIRFSLCIGSLVVMYLLIMSFNLKVPETPYTKALDVWTGTCLTFVYFVVVELCFMKAAFKNDDASSSEQSKLTNGDSVEEGNSMKLEDPKTRNPIQNYCSIPLRWINRYSTKAQRIDVICRVFYPPIFVIFIFFYWIAYCVM